MSRKLPRFFHRNYLWVTGIISGIVICRSLSVWPAAAVLLFLLTGLLLIRRCYRECFILLLALLLGSASCWIHQPVTMPDSRLENVQIRVLDSSAWGEVLHENETLPYRLRAEINDPRYPSCMVELYFPRKQTNPGLPDRVQARVSGNFYANALPPEFLFITANGSVRNAGTTFQRNGYSNYLLMHNICGRLIVEDIEFVSGNDDNKLARIRRTLIERLDSQLEQAEHRAILGALTLGARWRLPPEIKNKFAAVGMAHLFSISGLHVGVLAMLILLALRPLPLAWHWILVCSLAGYVAATGGAAPALRAFLMVLALEFFRGRLLRVRPLELLSLICGILLLWNPFFLTDGGFQYSFIITAMLIIAAPVVREISAAAAGEAVIIGELPWWKRKLYKWRGILCGGFCFAVIASAVSWPLTLFHQTQFFVGAIAVNFLILPLLTPLFVLAIVKCLLPCGAVFWNVPLNWIIDYLEFIAESFYSFTDVVPVMLPGAVTIAGMIFLMALLLLNSHRFAVGVIMLMLGLLWMVSYQRSAVQPPRLAVVISGGRTVHPVAAIIYPRSHCMYVLNASREAVYALLDVAAHYGIDHIDRLDFAYPVTDCVSGLSNLQRHLPIVCYRKSDQSIRSGNFRNYTQNIAMTSGADPHGITPGSDYSGKLTIRENSTGGWLVNYQNCNYNLLRTARVRVHIIE